MKIKIREDMKAENASPILKEVYERLNGKKRQPKVTLVDSLRIIRVHCGEAYWTLHTDGCGEPVSDYCQGCKHELVCLAFHRLDEIIRGLE